ncbi:MAG: hypothetical protein ABW178_04610 [Pseudoxanthomonas sp.]
MKTKMKLLDLTLISLLAGTVPLAHAQDATPPPRAEADAMHCTDEACQSSEGLLFRLRTRSYDQPVTQDTDARSGSAALQPDRRASVQLEAPGKAVAMGKFSLTLPNGGVVWATEDPTLGQPELSVSGPTLVAFDGQRITQPVPFFVRSNYAPFVARYELKLYRASDADLIDPLAQVDLPVAAVSQAQWEGELPSRLRYRAGDELVYVLRAYDSEGRFDETQPRTLQLVNPQEAERGAQRLRDAVQKSLGSIMSVSDAQTQSLVDTVFAENGLRQQNIPVYGSRVRLQGRNLPEGYRLSINGDSYPVDLERKFTAEYLTPVGEHPFAIALEGQPGERIERTLDVHVSGRYFFGVGLADVTVSQNKIGGSVEPFAVDNRYADDIISDGRLAFYMKAKAKGKYLFTAQADTTEKDLENLFTGFTQADAQDVFRRLDPDLYYPTYGDDSSTYRDVDTMGRFYLRMDWDKNQAMWGNYATGITGTEYAQYVRSLYGAALNWRSRGANAWGDPDSELRVFGSQAQTAPGHSEFVGTGGSLYYLKHTDVLPGSDVVVVETRDLTTGRVEARTPLTRGADYEIDELQGRILLTRPLSQVTRNNVPTLTRDAPLDGLQQRLVIDYEWVPSSFDDDQITAGLRGKQWFGDHLGVGATYVEENHAGEDYTLMGADVTLQAGKGTYLKVEHSRTESTSAPVFFSDNGGFTFTELTPTAGQDADATAIEARANFKELGWTQRDWSTAAWWRRVGAGYAISRYVTDQDVREVGAEVLGQVTDAFSLYGRISRAERGSESLEQGQVTGEWRIDDFNTVSAELRQVDEQRTTGDATGLLAAAKYLHRFGTSLDVYGVAQFTVDDDDGRYRDNDAYTLGTKYLFGDASSVGAEVTDGDRGNAAQVNAEYQLSPEQTVYGSYTISTDSTDYDPLFNPDRQNGWTLGQRWRLSNQVTMFNESQYLKNPDESGLAHTFGMDFFPAAGWNTGFTLQDGELTNREGGVVDRRAISLNGGRNTPNTDWQSKLEWRRDTGAERREQWVLTNRLTHKFSESWRMAARLNWSDTDDEVDPLAGAKFIEGNVGFAWRPWNSTRWGVFGRYTYLYDLSTLGQVNGSEVDQRTQVLSLEGVYRIDQRWELAAKAARREGEVRYTRGAGAWFDSATNFAAGQVRYDLLQQWHALAEYRWLDVKDGGTRQGWLAGVDRDIGRNFRIGAGYNFTDFSDRLTDFDYDHRGWYINVVGRY